MNNDWDTPPDGDFVRYLEHLTPPTPGAVTSAVTRAATNVRMNRPTVPSQASATPVRPGPPDLADALRQLFGQVAGEIRKTSNKR